MVEKERLEEEDWAEINQLFPCNRYMGKTG